MADILIVDDEESIAWGLRTAFTRAGHRVTVVATAEDAIKKVSANPPAVLFLDIRLPGMDGLTALKELTTLAPRAAIIVMTAHGDLNTAVQAVAGGAFDYLSKPFDLATALDAANRALARDGSSTVRDEPRPISDDLVGRSPAMQAVFKRIALVAPTAASVLITGESGTGKELVARAIHTNSPRKAKPFLPVHLAALNPNVVEAELFGHVKGAFTGADKSRDGLLTLANGGTVFLDELADIPPNVQAKLLRVLERQEILPVGGIEAHAVDVRIISATHDDLTAAVREGRFRHDLFFRLNVYPIHLPPLRERTADIPLIAEHVLKRTAPGSGPLPPETVALLQSRPWPGNVRELRNALEHAAIIARGGPLRPELFPSVAVGSQSTDSQLSDLVRQMIRERTTNGNDPTDLMDQLLAVVEPALISEVLGQLDGNRAAAARRLGLARGTLRRMMEKYGLGGDDEKDL